MALLSTGSIDKSVTKKVVEEKLGQYRAYKKKLGIEKAYGRETSDTEAMEKFVYCIESAIQHLPDVQQELIMERYIKNHGRTFDYIVKEKLMVAERTYYRLKTQALEGMAEVLGCEVYK